ncbi:TonB-dependent receptor [Ferruginibacter sp. HRS2-29]|uniref:SusC/RagA family TonB-linked outer membrane protein n=1 Tax=Ferruginibacter sp. HRS2-29 TaxID=2487334 RepID=UPI0020CF3592|nr:TonB-dependent receptor [Ferruginibacter sp. HRS2-29]MCP9753502.1 TonB-dependent receptor [Ferruginibacter sp. HRS2-29]
MKFLSIKTPGVFLLAFCLQLLCASSFAQGSRTVNGLVTTSSGQPLSGANVVMKDNAGAGTVTGPDGKFTLNVPAGKVILTISYSGYISRDVNADNAASLNIRLTENPSELSNVVVIGYGSARKSDLTGSVTSIKSDELKAVPVTSIDQAMQGRAAGVQVTQISGKPGAETSIRIRGTSSINAGNEPLYVIDGLLINSDGGDISVGGTRGPRISPLSSISPGDIESIEILKDASATSIYGSRGANGVVLITTKRGRTGKGTLSFETYYGSQTIANKVKVLNAAQFADLVNEAKINANQTPVYVNPPNLGKGTDWQNELFRTAPMTSYQLSFSGGDDKTKYAISGGYFDQDGIIYNSDFKRYSFRTNLERKLSGKLTVGNTLSYSRISSKGVLTNGGDIVPGVVTSALLFNPVLPVYDTTVNGGYTFENDRGKVLGNPIAEAREYSSLTVLSRILGNFFVRYNITPSLEFKTSFGIDGFSNDESSFGPNFLKRTQASNGEASLGKTTGITWLNENTLNFNKTFNQKHAVNAVAGYTLQHFNNEKLFVYAFDFPDNRTGYHNIAAALKPQKPYNLESEWSMVSYLGRVNYTFDNKYLFTATGRVDGSSKFADSKKYGFFPSGAFAWRVSKESFMQDVKAVSDLKIRTSYGVIGNQAIPPYQSLALVGPYGEGTFNTGSGTEVYTGQEPLSYVNKDLKWETTRQFDLGFDLSLFNNRVTFTADYYQKKTFDLLLSSPIPLTSGFSSTLLNIGNIENKGFDLDLRTINTTGKLGWTTSINFSSNKNKITQLNSSTDIMLQNAILLRNGVSIGTFYGYKFLGIFQSDAEAASSPVLVGQEPTSANPAAIAKAGDRKYADINNDGKIDASDRTILGTAQPKFTFGFNNAFSYKNIDLSFFFQGAYGGKLANFNNYDLLNFTGQNNVLAEAALNRWTPTNPSNKYPRALAAGGLDQGIFSDAIVENASYLRLKNVTLSYNLPAAVISRLKMSNLKVYVSGSNLFTITKYSGSDPEANTFGQSTTLVGIDLGGYPQTRIIQIGLSASF